MVLLVEKRLTVSSHNSSPLREYKAFATNDTIENNEIVSPIHRED